MYPANLNQVHPKNPKGEDYEAWVLLLRHGSQNKREKSIRELHENIEMVLAEQNVNYSEITTNDGKAMVYEKFNHRNGKHPLFFILNKPPQKYTKDDSLMIVEWGKWLDIEEMKDALIRFNPDSFDLVQPIARIRLF